MRASSTAPNPHYRLCYPSQYLAVCALEESAHRLPPHSLSESKEKAEDHLRNVLFSHNLASPGGTLRLTRRELLYKLEALTEEPRSCSSLGFSSCLLLAYLLPASLPKAAGKICVDFVSDYANCLLKGPFRGSPPPQDEIQLPQSDTPDSYDPEHSFSNCRDTPSIVLSARPQCCSSLPLFHVHLPPSNVASAPLMAQATSCPCPSPPNSTCPLRSGSRVQPAVEPPFLPTTNIMHDAAT